MGKKIYFVSDLHLGLYPSHKSLEREKLFTAWLDEIKDDVSELYLLGDIFDFWHEYKHVVPKGFTRFLGKLSELSDKGVKLHIFSGNHDVWSYGYFKTEFGAEIYHKPLIKNLNGLKFFLAHGDGLGPGEFGYKILIGAFRNKILQWLFARLHPNFALWIGKSWSRKSRYSKGIVGEKLKEEDKEFQIVFAKNTLSHTHYDFFIFGHRHIPYDIELGNNARIINLGDWISSFTYGELNGSDFTLKQYKHNGVGIFRKKHIPD